MSSKAQPRWRARLATIATPSWRQPALLVLLGALGAGYWSCAASPPPPSSPPGDAAGSDPSGTYPAVDVAERIAEANEPAPLLPVLNEEALTARVAAQRRLLGGDLFEDVRGQPVPWISPQDDLPPTDDTPAKAAADAASKLTTKSADDALLDSLPGSSGLGAPGESTEGSRVNGNALGLFMPIEGATEGEPPLAHFYDALRALRDGQDPDGKVRVLVYGGSHTDADVYPQYIRTYLQERFGDGGHGFVHIAKPWRWYRHADYWVEGVKYWKTEHAQRRKGRMDGLYGYMGTSLAAKSGRAFGRIHPRGGAVGSVHEVFFLRQPKGGKFRVLADGKALATVKTAADEFGPGYYRFVLPEGQHDIEIDVLGSGEVRMFGMTIEREQPGVVVDTLGIGGTRASNMLRWDLDIWADNVAHREPDLVTFFYGTNEATDVDQPIEVYENDLRAVLDRLAIVAPQASCLLMGPGDFPRRQDDGTWTNRERIDQIIDVQRRVAADHGCGFWDTKAFMGGHLSMPMWASAVPPMAKSDHIHFTKRGYVRIGMAVVDAMMVDFDGAEPGH